LSYRIYYSENKKTYFGVGNIFCSVCSKLVIGGSVLRESWFKKMPCIIDFACGGCVGSLPARHGDRTKKSGIICLLSNSDLPDDSVLCPLMPIEVGSGKYRDVWQSALVCEMGVDIVDNTRFSFKEQSDLSINYNQKALLLEQISDLDKPIKDDDEFDMLMNRIKSSVLVSDNVLDDKRKEVKRLE